MPKVQIRYQRVSDAKRFFEILNNLHFVYINIKPKSIKEEVNFLKGNPKKRKDNFEYNFTILYGNEVVGGCGIKINQHRKYTGEIGYFVDYAYWGKGIATKATKLLEKFAFNKLKLARLEIVMKLKNKASDKVAIKCCYKKEGLMKKALKGKGKYQDCYLYAKTR